MIGNKYKEINTSLDLSLRGIGRNFLGGVRL